MSITAKKHEMPSLDPAIRSGNFDEVALGYTAEIAVAEAQRCLNCKNAPCVSGCPVNVHIPDFISRIKESQFEEAYRIITKTSTLPAICGRVCPQETQCESKCTMGIKFEPVGIGRLERFVADYHNSHAEAAPERPTSNGHKVAIVGSGPSGLTCAGDLLKLGYQVSVFEALHKAGGVLVYGIPEFRLPKAIVEKEISSLRALGADIQTNVIIGKTITVDELFEMGYEAVFIGSGAGLPNFMHIEGENLRGVYSANEFLTRINLMKSYKKDAATPIRSPKKAVVVGGGNVAMDAARCAKRLGADVTVVYRRTREELPARAEEVAHALEEGIDFKFLHNPIYLTGNEAGDVTEVHCQEQELGEPDERGRCKPYPIEGSDVPVEADVVIIAIGTSPNPLIKNTTAGLSINSHGGIIVNEDGLTSREGVYAGGDAVTGAATVISAMGAGKLAAASIDRYLKEK